MKDAEIVKLVNEWLDQNWNPDLSLREWREKLVDGGWAMPHWPKEYYGRDFTMEQSAIVFNVFHERGAVTIPQDGSQRLPAETILSMGTEDQKRRFLRPILTGEHFWCQLFSEPGSGSDLAGLSTKAEFIDGKWIINGQKVWNSGADHAHFGILVARTDFDVPKHQGLSYFLINVQQPGVEVRPLKQMNGYDSFNEVFFDNAEVLVEDMIGGEGDGWDVAKVTLSYERRNNGVNLHVDVEPDFEGSGRCYEELEDYLKTVNAPYSWYPQRKGRVDLVVPRAKATGAIKDPATRQEIARLLCLQHGADLAGMAAEAKQTTTANAVMPASGSIGKLAASVVARQANAVHTMISGSDAMRTGPESSEGGDISEVFLSTPGISIAGGTDEIQRNIISERVLGMPKDIRTDKGPFRDIKRND